MSNLKRLFLFATLTLTLVCWASTARAQIEVLVLGPDDGVDDIPGNIILDFAPVMTGINWTPWDYTSQGTPTLQDLAGFDVVLYSWANACPPDPELLGDTLYQYYIQGGGGIVLGHYYWISEIACVPASNGDLTMIQPLSAVGGLPEHTVDSLDPTSIVPHEITAGVTALTEEWGRGGGEVDNGSTPLAMWTGLNDNGNPDPVVAIIESDGSRIAALSSAAWDYYYNSGEISGDYHLLWENVIKWAGNPCTDADGDGYGANGGTACPMPGEIDCDDSDPMVNPGMVEINNGIDDNCDGAIDEGTVDGFGYWFVNQNDPACSFDFVDISGTGTDLGSGDDTVFTSIALQEPFDFYGSDYSELGMSSNGFLSTDASNSGSDLSNDCPLPDPPGSGGGGRMMPLHDDLDLESGYGEGYHEYFAVCPRINPRCPDSACTIFQWDDVAHFPGGVSALTWDQQAILYHSTGDIVFQIGAGNQETGLSSTTGIMNPAYDDGLTYACNAAGTIPDDTAVCIFHPMPADPDGDGIVNPCDNCPGDANPLQEDVDGDGHGAACDCDDNNVDVYPGAVEDPVVIGEPDQIDNDCDGVADEGLMIPGDLLITEIMKNPDAVTDANGEWFEILNDSPFDWNLLGMAFTDNTAADAVDVDLIVPAGGYVVFGRNADTGTNGNVAIDFEWQGLTLANDADMVEVLHFDDMDVMFSIDIVVYSDATFPDDAGASMTLNPDFFDAALNDDGANWCNGQTPYGDGDLGTPAAMNDGCCVDLDGDGYGFPASTECANPEEDCNDADPTINPGVDEYCNGFDDDCDGFVDEPDSVDAEDWCDDADGDGFGDPAVCVHQCNAPGGTVNNNLDCDDTAVAINPNATEVCDEIDNNCDGSIDEGWPTWTWWPDADGDGYGEIGGTSITTCMVPGGYADNETDCDDTDAAVNPAATEVCDSVDNDCDGTVDVGAVDAVAYYADTDNDGFGDAADSQDACSQPSGYVVDDTDCDDTDPLVFPGANEQCNGVDDDCDGTIDDGITYVDYYPDTDGDAFGDVNGTPINDCSAPTGYIDNNGDCDDTDDTINPLAIETCDGVDEDCDGTIDDGLTFLDYYPDADSDTYGDASAVATSACDPPTGMVEDNTDCDDTNDAINPDADEVCDGVDNDCDGTIDEDDAIDAATWYEDFDGDGYGDNAVTTVACDAPTGYVADNTDCDDTAAAINPGANEVCNNGIDDDCDATTDETTDEDGDGLSECDGDCDDSDADVNPAAIEVCDGVDNDCNPATDEDVDDDGDLETECEGDCNDANAAVYSTATEICDGLDNDCDGSMGIDEVDADGDGSFLCDVPPDCDDADVLTYPGAPEQCDNLDNDCDGIIDEDTGVDQDMDGFTPCQGDCDDTDALVNPAAKVELCDGKDTDCDGITPADEVDADMDTYLACEECDDANPALNNNDADMDGASTCDGDCDDADPNLNIADGDADGDTTCDGDCDDTDAALNLDDNDLDGFSTCTGDCDDTDATANPDATEVCDSGVDNDCDGVADDVDADMDGFIDDDCGGDDCDDADDGVNPDADEICDDTIDNDCDGDVDGDDVDCGDDDDSGDDDSGDDDSGDDDSGDDDDGDDDTGDDDTDTGGDCECNADMTGTPVAPAVALLALLGLVAIRRRH